MHEENILDKKLLTLEELSAKLGFAKSTLYKFTMNREMPFYRIGRRIVVDPDEISDWVRKKFHVAPIE